MKFRLPTAASAAINQQALAATTATDIPSAVTHSTDNEKTVTTNVDSDSDSEYEKVDPTAQHGAQQAQAMKHLWSPKMLALAFVL